MSSASLISHNSLSYNCVRYTAMLSNRLILSIPFLLSLLPSYGLSEPSNPTTNERDGASDVEVLQRLLNQVDPPALHSLLHEYSPKEFKHGMFMEDRTAVEAIHRDDPPLAASIVSLAKRQGNNVTVSTPPAPSVPASSITSVELSPSTSNSDQASTTPPSDETSATSATGTDTASPTVTSTDGQQSTPTDESASTSATSSDGIESSSYSAGSVFTITNTYGVVIVTTSGGGASTIATASVSPSATNSGSTITTKASTISSKSSQTSVFKYTSTLPNGSRSYITATTVVAEAEGPTPTGSAGVTGGSVSTTTAPGLQTGMAVRTGSVGKEMLCVFGGAVGVAMLMW